MTTRLYNDLKQSTRAADENKDCTVKAWAVVAGLSYEDAHNDLAEHGRKHGRPFHMRRSLDRLLRRRDLVGYDVTVYWRKQGVKTVTTATKLHNKGTYLVFTRGHVLAVKGGEIHDWTVGTKRQVRQIIQVS